MSRTTPSTNAPPASAYREYLDSELASENERSIHSTITQIARYGLLKFGMVSIASPFETARLLRQIQIGGEADEEEEDDEGKAQVPEGWQTAQSMWWDSSAVEQQRRERMEHLTRSESQRIAEMYAANGEIVPEGRTRLPSEVSRDPSGYLLEKSVCPYRTSEWPLILDKKRSLWHSLGEISRRQGLFSLWQGVVTGWTLDVMTDLGRATVEEALESSDLIREHMRMMIPMVSPLFEEEVMRPTLISGIAQGIVGTLLSPIELVRLRLVAQSVWVPERKYLGFWDALRTITREETGIFGLFRHPILTFTSFFIKPVLRVLPVSMLNFYFGPTENASLLVSVAWMILQNIVMCTSLLITLPLETIRTRLLIQSSGKGHRLPFITRVKISSKPYTGVINCLWRMLREEGISSLYQGWGIQVASTTASFATTLLAELGEEDFGSEHGLDEF